MNLSDITINVSIAETDLFMDMLEVCKDFANDEEIPEHKRKLFVERLVEIGVLRE